MDAYAGFAKPGGWLFLGWLVLAPISPVWAQAPEPKNKSTYMEVRRLTNQGTRFFRAAEYKKARLKFEQAYSLHPDPNLVFNIARCHEEEGNLDMAIEKLGQYLAESEADPAVRKKVVARLSKLQRMRSKMEADRQTMTSSSSSRSKENPPTASTLQTRPPENQSSAVAGSVDRQPERSTSSFDWKWWKWTSLGAGAAVALAGGVVFALGEADHREVFEAQRDNPVTSMSRAEALDLLDSGNTKKTIGYICFGAGGAVMLGSLVLFLLEPDTTVVSPSTRISARPSNGGAMFVWSQSF